MNTEVENADGEATTPPRQRLNLNVDIRETSACERHVTVTIPRPDIDRYFAQKFDDLVPMAEVPGFRAGKAPRKLVESRFRPHVKDQVKGALLLDSLAQMGDDNLFSAISEPDFDFELIEVPEEGPMTFEFNIEVRPEFDLPNWKGMTLKQTEWEITPDQIEAAVQRLTGNASDLVPVEEPAGEGDYVVCNIRSIRNGQLVSSLDEALIEVRESLILGDATIENFGKLMKGARSGETRSASAKIASEEAPEEFRGQELEIEFEVLDVKRPEAANVDEAAREMGFDGAGALREAVRSRLESQNEYRQHQEIREQITRLLTQSANWQLPQPLLRRQARREMERAIMELRSSNFSESEIAMQENLLRHNVLQRTEAMLKEHFILEKIAESGNIEASDDEITNEIGRIAAQHNDSPRRVRARLERNGQMDALRNMIIEKKVIWQIEEHAKIDIVREKPRKTASSSSLDFFASGSPEEAIPVAKYEDTPEAKLPTPKQERS